MSLVGPYDAEVPLEDAFRDRFRSLAMVVVVDLVVGSHLSLANVVSSS